MLGCLGGGFRDFRDCYSAAWVVKRSGQVLGLDCRKWGQKQLSKRQWKSQLISFQLQSNTRSLGHKPAVPTTLRTASNIEQVHDDDDDDDDRNGYKS